MKKWFYLLAGAMLVGAFLMAGCFSSPTDPHPGAFSGVKGGGSSFNPTATPTAVVHATATATPAINYNGSITGTLSGTAIGTVTVTAQNTSSGQVYVTQRVGIGVFTISGLPDGNYSVSAYSSATNAGTYLSVVSISGGNNVSGIDFVMY